MAGYTFRPSLQDISLKRFRLRYSVVSDCYYLHWDQTVCPQLARIEGLAKGAMAVSGLTRCTDQEGKRGFLCLSDGARDGEVQWRLDFSHCGLAVRTMTLRAASDVREGGIVTCRVTGDTSSSAVFSDLGDKAIEVPQVTGKGVITITAHLWRTSEWSTPYFLQEASSTQCPLDIVIELMVMHGDMLRFVGDLLLGLKFSSHRTDGSDHPSHIGQLQVHVVEGAGLVDMETHEPFNACIKCGILPAREHCPTTQTSPRHNAYPTWSKEILFSDLDRAALQDGGLEVVLSDHHFFRNDIIGGIRLGIPQKKHTISSQLNGVSPCLSSPSSPFSPMIYPIKPTNDNTPGFPKSPLSEHREEWLLTPPDSPNTGRVGLGKRSPLASPLMSHRTFSKSPSPSPSLKCSHKFSPFSPNTLSSPKLSPRSLSQDAPKSPKMSQDIQRSPRLLRMFSNWTSRSSSLSFDTDYLHWWMDSAGTEVQHWQDMLDNEGEWVYCWHTLRPKLQPASF